MTRLLLATSLPLLAGAGGVAYTAQRVVLPDTLNTTPLERCAFALGAGLLKEAYDHTGQGDVEARDVLFTLGGCLVLDLVVQTVAGNDPLDRHPTLTYTRRALSPVIPHTAERSRDGYDPHHRRRCPHPRPGTPLDLLAGRARR
jgi:hypothetical protein